jgi:TRAP-type transport system periplasmic protein
MTSLEKSRSSMLKWGTGVILLVSSLMAPMLGFTADITLRLGHGVSAQHVYQFSAEYIAKRLAEETGNKVELKIFPNAQLGNEEALANALRLGSVDLAFISAANASPFVPEFGFLSVGYIFSSFEHFQKTAKDNTFGSMIDKLIDKRKVGFSRVAILTSGVRNFYDNKGLIKEPEDIRGMKMRVMTSATEAKIWAGKFGVLPIATTTGEVYTSMQTGLVEASDGPLGTYYTAKLYEVAPYVALTEHNWGLNFLFVSDRTLGKLPENVKKALLAIGKEVTDIAGKKVVEDDQKYLEILQTKYGVKVAKIDKQPFQQRVIPIQDEVAKEFGAMDILQRIRDLR